MDSKIRWGILATGSIAETFARDLKHSHHGILTGVASRTPARAQEFCNTHGGAPSSDYGALLARDDIDAVYIATPHDAHVVWAHRALEAGKATLCEKPLGLNQGEVLSLYGAAARTGVLLVEALMYVMHPRMHLARKLLDDGEIGTVTGFSSGFGFAFPFTPEHRLYNRDRAGGGILDIGIYPLTAARFLLGEPASLSGDARLAPTQVDAEARARLDYGDFAAELHCAVDTEIPWQICVTGTKGTMTIDQPWHSGPDNQAVIITREDATQRSYDSAETRPLYAVEADHVAECLMRGDTVSALVSPDFSINTAYWLDRWREAGGVTYAADTLDANGFDAVPPQAARHATMPVLHLDGLDKPVSRLVLGTDNQVDVATLAAMGDAFFEHGGTCIDTAHIYSDGMSETALGAWIEARGIRENLVILGKGAHPPDCTPDAMARQLDESLERLRTDYLDIYCLHRDNRDIPIAEWVDGLHAEIDKGRIRVFGGSNWTSARLDAANDYARSKGRSGFSLVSNNFSLARMEKPVWDGCLASSTDDFRDWHTRTGIALFPWSAQARGFFLDWESVPLSAARHGADPTIEEMHRVWGSPENLERRKRAMELAARKNTSALQIALAYVLHQPFPTAALIGPRTPMQLVDSIAACNIELSRDEVNWLDLRADNAGN